MTAPLLMWASVPVPRVALWTAEDRNFLAPDPLVRGQIAVCNDEAQGQGKPVFGTPHMQRQRKFVIEGLCDLCGRPLKGRSKVSLSHASERVGAAGLCVMQVEPMLHRECAAISLVHCPSLRRDTRANALHIRLVTRYRVQLAQLTGDATEQFTGTRHPGAIGHAKIELLDWQDKDLSWLN